MSFKEQLTNHIGDAISKFIDILSSKYSIDKDELEMIWSGKEPQVVEFSLDRIYKANKAELSAMCKAKGLKCTGTKDELISRLNGGSDKNEMKKESDDKSAKKETKKEQGKNNMPSLLRAITSKISDTPIKRNQFGNFEHAETRLVFNRDTQTVNGKQQDDGTVSSLTDEDIELCKKFKFNFKIPDNLDKDNLDNVKVAEIDDIDEIVQVEKEDVEKEDVEKEDVEKEDVEDVVDDEEEEEIEIEEDDE